MAEAHLTDVTYLLGSEQQRLEEELFEVFQETYAVATSRLNVSSFRACVAAYDDYYRAVCEGAKSGKDQNGQA